MRNFALAFFAAAVLFSAPRAFAYNPDCPSQVDMYQGVQAQLFFYKSANACALLVSPTTKGQRWRSYSFFSNGLFMIFNNLGNGPSATDTASRSYFFFPRLVNPAYTLTRSGLLVRMPTGDKLVFDYKTARIKPAGATIGVQEDPKVHGQNFGGVEIKSQKGILLDTGYLVGEVAHSIPSRYSKARDRRGRSCQLRNDLLFKYVYSNDPYGKPQLQSVDFKFPTDREFANFLSKMCPSLDVSPLLKVLTRSVAQKPRPKQNKKI